jgi:hypothetical protein
MKTSIIYIFLNTLFVNNYAYAYLDPASGSALIAGASTFLFSIVAIITTYIKFILGLIILYKNKINFFSKYNLIIHSEYSDYYSTFYFIIDQNINKNNKILIICTREFANKFEKKYDETNIINIKLCITDTLFCQVAALSLLKSEKLITSTPHLNLNYFNRNNRIHKYLYLPHACSDVHEYNILAFDHFDIIYCFNINIKHNLMKIISNRKPLIMPDIFVINCQYLLYAKENYKIDPDHVNKSTILIAPSWGDGCLLRLFNPELLNALFYLATNLFSRIIFRPHPQSLSSKDPFIEIINSFFNSKNINYSMDVSSNPFPVLRDSSLLITDFSSIVYDYHFINNNPYTICYYLNSTKEISLKEKIFLNSNSLEYSQYKMHTLFCENYNELLNSIANFSFNLVIDKIDVNDLFLSQQTCDFISLYD